MITTVDTLFGLVFLGQVVILSFYWPRVLAGRLAAASPVSRAGEGEGPTPLDRRLALYPSANILVIALGLVLLALLFTLDAFESLEAMLLAIGLYFFLQLSPLALVRSHLASSRAVETAPQPDGPIRFFDLVPPALVGIACALLLAYAAAQLALSGGGWGPRTLKVSILVSANAFFATVLAWNLHQVRRRQGEARLERLRELQKAAPMLVYISIGLSVYFFGKDVIFAVGVPRLRLIMMTSFLQILGILAYSKIVAR
jgi:hypothetical protein